MDLVTVEQANTMKDQPEYVQLYEAYKDIWYTDELTGSSVMLMPDGEERVWTNYKDISYMVKSLYPNITEEIVRSITRKSVKNAYVDRFNSMLVESRKFTLMESQQFIIDALSAYDVDNPDYLLTFVLSIGAQVIFNQNNVGRKIAPMTYWLLGNQGLGKSVLIESLGYGISRQYDPHKKGNNKEEAVRAIVSAPIAILNEAKVLSDTEVAEFKARTTDVKIETAFKWASLKTMNNMAVQLYSTNTQELFKEYNRRAWVVTIQGEDNENARLMRAMTKLGNGDTQAGFTRMQEELMLHVLNIVQVLGFDVMKEIVGGEFKEERELEVKAHMYRSLDVVEVSQAVGDTVDIVAGDYISVDDMLALINTEGRKPISFAKIERQLKELGWVITSNREHFYNKDAVRAKIKEHIESHVAGYKSGDVVELLPIRDSVPYDFMTPTHATRMFSSLGYTNFVSNNVKYLNIP